MKHVKLIYSLLIITTAVFGDFIVFKSKFSGSQTFRALADSIVHALIGFLSCLTFFSYDLNISNDSLLFYLLFCTFVASLIDIDHVFVAKSIWIKDLTSTKQRGVLHCTSLWCVATLTFFIYSYYKRQLTIFLLTWMLVLAFSSHHLRDGNRRGLWMFPFGHTPPINKFVYVITSAVLPHIFAVIYKYTKPLFYIDTTIHYFVV